jgi:23S rRNA pseudouridine1911/1915/1917 synthase
MSSNAEHFKVSVKSSLARFLESTFPQSSRTSLKKMVINGNISLNNRIARNPSVEVNPGDMISYQRQVILRGESSPFRLIHEDAYILVIDKPAGILTYGEKGSDGTSAYKELKDYLSKTAKARVDLFVVHRLDREVSGLLMYAKSPEIQEKLKGGWSESIKKYFAFVEGIPEPNEGTIKSWLSDGPNYKVISGDKREGARFAVTNYKVIQVKEGNALLEVQLETGRKNQIRVHLSDFGHPVIGDRRYGADATYERRIRLHACFLSVRHPITNQQIEFKSGLPKGFLTLKMENEVYK